MQPTKNQIFFVYTINNTPSIGGVTPQDIEIGIGNYKNIYSGRCSDPLELLNISEFNPIPCTEDAARGLNLIGLTETTLLGEDGSIAKETLNDTHKRRQLAATKLIDKLRKRFSIKTTAGDDGDLLADLSKRVSILERVSMSVFDKIINSNKINTTDLKTFKAIIKSYKLDLTNSDINDQIDSENLAELSKTLRLKSAKIAKTVSESN